MLTPILRARTGRILPLLAPWLLLAAAGCTQPHDHEHAQGDAGHDAAVELTAHRLGDTYLVHLIHPPLVRGESARSIVHGTLLESGGPMTGVRVALTVRKDGAERRLEAREEIPGHFPLQIDLPEAGAWRLGIEVAGPSGAETLDLGDVQVHADRAAAVAERPPQVSGAFDFLFESQWEHGVRFERAAPGRIVQRLSAPGRVQARPGGEAHVVAPAAGRVLPPEGGALPVPGARVAAGDVLGYIEPPFGASDLVALHALEIQQHQLRHELDLQQLDAERALGAARVRIQVAERDLERARRLLEQTLGTQQDVDRALGELELARSEQRAAQGSLDSVARLRGEHAEDPDVAPPRIALRAPIAGTIAAADAVSGEAVDVGATLFTVLDLAQVWAVAEVSELELARLGADPRASVRLPGTGDRLEARGAPAFVSPRVDPETRCVSIAFALDNPDGRLRAGMMCEVEMAVGVLDAALTLPEEAIAWERGGPIAFAMAHGESFRKLRLTLGARDAGRVHVVSGLAAGDVVVVRSAEELRLASLGGGGFGEGHVH